MHCNALPIDCLIVIFRKIPLQGLFTLREVCSHWKEIIKGELFRPRRSLKLFANSKSIKKYALQLICENARENVYLKLRSVPEKDDDLLLHQSNAQTFTFLLDVFPQIEHLVLYFDNDLTFQREAPLFIAQSHQLVRLSLCGYMTGNNIDFVARLCQAINSHHQHLTSLDLLANNAFENNQSTSWFPIELPRVLRKLKHFSLIEFNGDLVETLSKLSAKCTSLRLDLIPHIHDKLPRAISSCPVLSENVTHLRIFLDKLENARQLLLYICEHFKQLTFLDFQSCPMFNSGVISFDSPILVSLNKLPHLTELRLSHIAIDLNLTQLLAIPQLSRISILHLSQVTQTPNDSSFPFIQTTTSALTWQIISQIFTHVQQLNIRVKRSSIVNIEEHVKGYFPRVQQCRVYCVADQVEPHFGRHFDVYMNFPRKSFRVFESNSELLFDFIKDL